MASSRTVRFFACFVLLICFVMNHSSAAAPYEVHFQNGVFNPPAGQIQVPSASSTAGVNGRVHALVQLDNYLVKGQRQRLANAGVELLVYLPDRAYVAAISETPDVAQLKTLGVRFLSTMPAEYKLHPRLLEKRFGPWSEYTDSRRILSVDIMPDVPLDEAQAILEKAGCEVGHRFEAAHTLLVAYDPDKVYELTALDMVLFVNEASPPMSMVNNTERTRLHVNEVQAAPYNLSGSGVTIMVYDGGMIDSTHPDFGDRVTWSESGTVVDHPTHVAGTCGAGGGTYHGMAPQVRLISGKYDNCVPYCLYDSPNDFEPDYTRARLTFNIEATTNSIGANIDPNSYDCEWFGDYETTSRLLDGLAKSTAGTPLIMFFAAGNERGGTHCGNASYSCMSVPAGAKNIITIGATNGSDQVVDFSSWGPTDDGRTKPDVCADGWNITSTLPGGGYGQMSGTSMATPATAGVGCLILQEWHILFPGTSDPLPETMKAILINSTTDIGPAGVDFQTGYGLVNALKAVQNMIGGGILESSLEVGEEYTHQFDVADGLSALDVSLAWSDVPAAGNVIPTLVNDLDLTLVDPSGGTHYPWRLRPATPSLPVQMGRDSINNCERVHVATPAAGTWTLHVTGLLNGSDTQTFGLSGNVALVPTWATISGQLRNSDGQGVPGRVRIVGGSQISDTDPTGNYVLSVPGNATYTISAMAYGFVSQSTSVSVTSGSTTMDFTMAPAANGTISGTVTSQFGSPLSGAIISFSFPRATIPNETTNAAGAYTATLPGGASYDLTADYFGGQMHSTVALEENGTATADFTFDDARFAPAGPDTFGYMAYEISDPGLSAVYDWLEVSPVSGGLGTPIHGTPGNDWVVSVTMPFTFKFYGQDQTQIQVGADGWVRVGPPQTADSVYKNFPIPTARVPNGMIDVFWDDLYPYDTSHPGDIAYYYDQLNHRFIVEYHHVAHYTPRTNQVTAQLVIYDQMVRPTRTGDNEFEIQYQSVDYSDGTGGTDDDATIGIENYTGTDGIQIAYANTWNPACFQIGAGYAIRFTTGVVPGFGRVEGQLTMHPMPADPNTVTVTLGSYTVHPNASGFFARDSVVSGTYTITVACPGYETGTANNLVIAEADTTVQNFELYRLDAPRNLTGTYEPSTHQIHLTWQWPAWHGGPAAVTGHGGGNRLDDFVGFSVMATGLGQIGTVNNDTVFAYTALQSRSYEFWIKADYSGGTGDTSNHFRMDVDLNASAIGSGIPTTFYLKPNYPNPFNPSTQIEYGLPRDANVKVEVYDILGQRVATLQGGVQAAGVHRLTFDANGLGSGVYYCRLQAGDFEQVQKMLLMR